VICPAEHEIDDPIRPLAESPDSKLKDHGPSVKNDEQYEGLRKKG